MKKLKFKNMEEKKEDQKKRIWKNQDCALFFSCLLNFMGCTLT